MSVLIKDMEIPKSCSECKLDLRTDICKAFCEWNAEHPYSIRATDRLPDCPLSVVPELCEDTVPRASVEYICQKNTVSTNPYKHEYHEKFIKFMDDPEIADFGRWEHSNGFNTALVAVKCDLDKVPSVTPKQPEPHWHPVNEQPQEDDDYLLLTHEKTKYGTFKRIIIGAWNGATKEWLEEYEGMYRDVNHPVAWMSKEELLLLKGWKVTE